MNPLTFLSYSSKDKLVADAICARLENQGIRCWIAPRDVKPGADYSNQIADALESATTMVMVFSSESNNSRHVKSEIDRAFSLGKIIIPFRVENVELDKGLAYYLAKTHWLDAVTKPLEQHIDKLAATIRQISGTDAPEIAQRPPPPPPPPPVAAPVPKPGGSKIPWLIAGVVVFCALLGSAVLLFLWLNQRKTETVRISQAPAVSTPASVTASASPSAARTKKKLIEPAAEVNSEQNKFEGTWTIAEAETLNGNPYTGTVRITKNGKRYDVAWKSTASNASGIALASGNKLCVAWGTGNYGVVLYKIGSDGTLRGRWTGSAAEAEKSDGLENAIGGAAGTLAGNYVVKGSNPGGGGSYEGRLKIAETGATYQLEWKVADKVTKGVGIKVEDSLFVAWGDKEPFGVVSYTFEESEAKGFWTLAGTDRTATENLTK
jgi:hypothetical protein